MGSNHRLGMKYNMSLGCLTSYGSLKRTPFRNEDAFFLALRYLGLEQVLANGIDHPFDSLRTVNVEHDCRTTSNATRAVRVRSLMDLDLWSASMILFGSMAQTPC